jgi:hypothetical protein
VIHWLSILRRILLFAGSSHPFDKGMAGRTGSPANSWLQPKIHVVADRGEQERGNAAQRSRLACAPLQLL